MQSTGASYREKKTSISKAAEPPLQQIVFCVTAFDLPGARFASKACGFNLVLQDASS